MKHPQGFSSLEVLIAVAILALLTGALYSVFQSSVIIFAEAAPRSHLNSQARDILDQISLDLSNSAVTTFNPTLSENSPTSTTLTFKRNKGTFKGGSIVYEDEITYAFQLAPTERDNNLDDDFDGRVDNGFLTVTENGDTVVISRDLAEDGLKFTLNKFTENKNIDTRNIVTVELILQRIDDQRRVIQHQEAISIQIRNN